MKKATIENIIIIIVVAASLFSGKFNYSVYCVAEECCKTECCVESSSSDYSDLHLSVKNSDCCTYNEAFENEVHAVSSLNTVVKSNITSPSILQHHLPYKDENRYIAKKSLVYNKPESHSISILRI